MKIKTLTLAIGAAAVLLALSGGTALAQERHDRSDDNGQQAARDWYNQHKDHPPVGFRNEDRLSADEDARLRDGVVVDKHLRRRMHSAPHDLVRHLPPPEHGHRYVVIGGHVAMIDGRNHVKTVIRLHD